VTDTDSDGFPPGIGIAMGAALAAGQAIREVYVTAFDVMFKGADDPVTEADQRANAKIVAMLAAQFPDDAIVAEEGSGRDVPGASRVWFVDPLDGTKEFIAKNGEFSVMIGLAVDGVATLGVVYQPTTDRYWLGALGAGAFLYEGRGGAPIVTPIRVSDTADPSALRLVVSRSHRSPETDAMRDALGITSERPSGSVGLKVGLLATNEADLYVHLSDKSHLWDCCAPEAILVAAGGRFTGLDGEPIRYAVGPTRNARGILACNAAAFDAVLPAARDAAKRAGLL
jgi:3'(2'), 5'-bisphosphate nucleotidase